MCIKLGRALVFCPARPLNVMHVIGQKQMTPVPIKTKENDQINHCQCARLQSLRSMKGENMTLSHSRTENHLKSFTLYF